MNAVAGNALAQDRVNRDASGDARLHGQVDARGDGAIPELGAASAISSLFAVTTDFPLRDRGLDDFARHAGAADQFGDDMNVRIDPPPRASPPF